MSQGRLGVHGDDQSAVVPAQRGTRRREVDDLAGELVRRAHRLGVPVPVTETCYRLIWGLEDGFRNE